MQLRGHGNAVAIALAGLAVVMAATGTAYAVTSSRVNIADRTTPSHVAHVDRYGRLSVAGPVTGKIAVTGKVAVTSAPVPKPVLTTINATGSAFVDDPHAGITSPTTATLAVTSINLDNSFNRIYANTDYTVQLYKITVGATGQCYSSDTTVVRYRNDAVSQGQAVNVTFPFPLAFSPTAGKKYCIGVAVFSDDSSHPTPYYAVNVAIGAYVVSGSYTGVGTAATPARAAGATPQLRR